MALVVLAGLPGAGKSVVADGLGRRLRAPVLSVDPVESAMWRAGVAREQPTGLAAYVVVDTLARHILALGQDVIVDAVNAVEPARAQWRAIAADRAVPLRFIEVVCSDVDEHRRRLRVRDRPIAGFERTPWAAVEATMAAYQPWADERLVLDSMRDTADNLDRAVGYLTFAGGV